MTLVNCVFVFLAFTSLNLNSEPVEAIAVIEVFQWTKNVLGLLSEAIDIYEEFKDITVPTSNKEKKLYASLANITTLIDHLEHDIPQVTIAKIKELERDFSEIIHFEIKLDDLINHINNIDTKYEKFVKFRKKVTNLDKESANKSIATKYTLERIANAYLFDSGNVADSLDKIHQIVNGETVLFGKQDVFTLILSNFNSNYQSRCLINKSPQQLIHDVHTSIRMVQLKGLVMIEFSYMILNLYTGGDYKEWMDETHDLAIKRFNEQAEVANQVLQKADNSMWKCDPENHVAGKTYTELTRLLQGYIHNEIELSHDKSCSDGCEHYSHVNKPDCSNKDPLCTRQPKCNGRVFDCRFVDEDMKICFSKPLSNRRYDWIHYDNHGEKYGPTENGCPNSESKLKMFRKYLVWRCFYCFCICDEESILSDRFFSLEAASSDITSNKIVVGVRFIKQDRVIHLQVKEGKLEPGGNIDNSTLSWVSLPTIDVNSWRDKPKYHTMKYESRSLDLDDLVAVENALVTGVRFRTLGEHLNLEIRLTVFNVTTGKLIPELSFWKGNDNTDIMEKPRSKQVLKSTIPATVNVKDFSQPDSKVDSYVEFTYSDKRTDAAQSTVPFIDIQEVVPEPPVPLVGLGLIHKQSLGSAGFIEPKVFTYNIGEQIVKNELRTRTRK